MPIALAARISCADQAPLVATHALSRGAHREGDGYVWKAGREDAAVRAALAVASGGCAAGVGVHASPDTTLALAGARALADSAAAGLARVSKPVERGVPRAFRFRELPALELPGETVLPYEVLEAISGAGEFGEGVAAAPAVPAGPIVFTGAAPAGAAAAAAVRAAARRAGRWTAAGRAATDARFPLEALAGVAWDEAGVSGLDRGDALRVARRVVVDLDDEDAAWAVARSPGVGGPAARAAWVRWLSARGPGVLSLEDLPRADAESCALLEDLARVPGLVCLATAPSSAEAPPGFRVVPVAGPEPEGPDPLARLDALSRETRGVLTAAAVVGRTFWMLFVSRLLAAEVGDALEEARRAGVIAARPESLMQSDGQWMFVLDGYRVRLLAAAPPAELAGHRAAAARLYRQLAAYGGAHLALLAGHQERAIPEPGNPAGTGANSAKPSP